MVEMGTENIADCVARWAQEMGLPVDNFMDFHESINDPTMKAAWLHIVKHVRPKQEVEHINRVIADYEFLKKYARDDGVQVSIHKPEDVVLYEKREKLRQILRQKKEEEARLDDEILMARKQLRERRNTDLALKKSVKSKEHKSHALKLKMAETKQVIGKLRETNEKARSLLNSCDGVERDKALLLIKQCIKDLMTLRKEELDLNWEFWSNMKSELFTQSPRVVIEGALCFCQDLCASIDALVYNQCKPQGVADFSPVEAELTNMRTELIESHAELTKLETMNREYSEKINTLYEDITQLILKQIKIKEKIKIKEMLDELDIQNYCLLRRAIKLETAVQEVNQDIGKIKADRFREMIEHERLATQVEEVKRYLSNVDETSDSDTSTLHNMSADEKAEVKAAIDLMESQARNIRDQVSQFCNMSQFFRELKHSQDESDESFRENTNKMAALKCLEFGNKLVQVHTWLVQISDENYSNKIDNFPVESGSVDLKQIHHMLASLRALHNMKPLSFVNKDAESTRHATISASYTLPDNLSTEAMERCDSKLISLKTMFRSLNMK